MPCCGQHSGNGSGAVDRRVGNENYIRPDEPCVLCAEKHLSTAYALAKENGYESINRHAIIGQLVAASWHLYADNSAIAGKIRDIRHLIQKRREAEVDWNTVLVEVDALASRETRDTSAAPSQTTP
ncbi:MAG: hypothetical protein KBC66_04090 [Kiritimatiellae bacterium]|jgi:hypothetical protein|nr:hypothetical protein [Kiritimatiellia bacterium]NLD90737.1 hypothetical protein [Lentisphaerota bacterium]HPC18565.1 hypothetical protein [Kiritimatiellia bacterium]HQQ60263.1 hypothetical protein [Kiritimatiellia bacterium]